MKAIIHIGWSKTGTTAFQNWLIAHQQLLDDAGLLYPHTGRWHEGAHHGLALALQPIPGYASDVPAEMLWRQLRDEIDEKNQEGRFHTLLLTSELLPPLYRHPLVSETLADLVTEWEVLAVVREQVALLRSMHSQLVGDPRVRFQADMLELFHRNCEHYLYYEALHGYRVELPAATLRVLVYQSAIVQQLLRHLGLEPADEPSCVANVSAPPAAVELIRRLNAIELSDEVRRSINSTVKATFLDLALTPARFSPITDEQEALIKEYYRESNQKLFDEFGVRLAPA